MNLYQIKEVTEKSNNAGTKAVEDVAQIAEDLGFIPAFIHMDSNNPDAISKFKRQLVWSRDFHKAYHQIPENSVLLCQHPFHHNQLTRNPVLQKLKNEKNVKIISFVHDVEMLRGYRNNSYYEREFNTMLGLADVLIVHNERMKSFFVENGYDESKIIVLSVFDYLLPDSEILHPHYSKTINIAGNLDARKSSYIAHLSELVGVNINLFGSNYDSNQIAGENIKYKGSFPPNQIPFHFTEGFGLVWDGESIDSCSGPAGNYLRFNNPHKTSLYLASGLPVIVWSQAAIADFVLREKCGITIDSLHDIVSMIEKISEADYLELVENARQVGGRLRLGFYAKKAIIMALKKE